MKRTIKVKAGSTKGSGVELEITAKIKTELLTIDEAVYFRDVLADRLLTLLPGLPYTEFHISRASLRYGE